MTSPAHPRARQLPRRPTPRPGAGARAHRWRLWCTALVSGLVLAVSGVGHAMLVSLAAEVDRVDPFHGLTDRPGPSRGTNILVVGADSRDDLTPAQRARYQLGGAACRCTDTILLVHVSADRDRLGVISIPRDTYVELPVSAAERADGARTSAQKLNAAYAHGGPTATVRAVESLTRVHVNHYLELDFTGFMRAVDALGGVPVHTSRPLRDPRSGLDLPAGTTVLDGGTALRYVRARSLDGAGDLGRMHRQQHLLAAVLRKATGGGVLTNPARLREVTGALLGSVRADPGFGQAQMLRLGRALRGLSSSATRFVSVPVADAGYPVPGVGQTVRWDRVGAEALFTAVREDRPLPRTLPRGRPAVPRERTPGQPGSGPPAARDAAPQAPEPKAPSPATPPSAGTEPSDPGAGTWRMPPERPPGGQAPPTDAGTAFPADPVPGDTDRGAPPTEPPAAQLPWPEERPEEPEPPSGGWAEQMVPWYEEPPRAVPAGRSVPRSRGRTPRAGRRAGGHGRG